MTETFKVGITPNGWQKAVHFEEVWGTVVVLEVRANALPENVQTALEDAAKFLHQVDDWFSTYRIDTPISALRMGFADFVQMPLPVQQVLDECEQIKELTRGAFDPWAVPGGVDPSGYVKGWAAGVVADYLVQQGLENVCINAAGDISCRGLQDADQVWVAGIQHPVAADAIVASVELRDTSMATSGEYERGKHIINPKTGSRDLSLLSASVIGPDGGLADALATALLIEGISGAAWIEELPHWSAVLIDEQNVYTIGSAQVQSVN